MIHLPRSSLIALAIVASSCGGGSGSDSSHSAIPKAVQTGTASFYSGAFAGKETANGEKLKLDAMTAASRTLPLGTHVEVSNMETGESATVRINDRGPYAKGRVIDLTPKAARHIGIERHEGVAPVEIKPTAPPAESKP